jgi:hypothetical protein
MRSSNWIEGDSNSGRIVVNPDAIFGNLAADPFRPGEVTDNETLQEVHQNVMTMWHADPLVTTRSVYGNVAASQTAMSP